MYMNTYPLKTQELFFLISPPRHILSDVSVLKDDIQYLIGHEFEDRYSRAHVSLFKFEHEEECVHEMMSIVEEKAAYFNPFNVFIKNLNVFYKGSARTIYMDIVNKYPLRDIFEKLIPEESANFFPHIRLAHQLSSEDFLKAWPYLKDFSYSQHFLCDRITVLARTDKQWVHYKDILFGG
jgi:2'-5' RNA ligase